MRLTRKEFADFTGYSEHEISQFIAEGMPVGRRFGLLGQVEIGPYRAVPWVLRRAGVEPDIEEEETAHYHVDEVAAEFDRTLAEVLNDLSLEETQRLAGKSPDELSFLLRRYSRERVAEFSEKLREAFPPEDEPDEEEPDE